MTLRDLAHARSAITFLEEEANDHEQYSLAERRRFICYETTLIVSYARPFSESRGSIPRLQYKALGIKLSPFTQTLHDELITKRNKIFAHSDADAIVYAPPTAMRAQRPDGSEFTSLFPPRFQEGTLLDDVRVQQTSVLVCSLLGAVMARLQAMHVNFLDLLPTMDLDLNASGSTSAPS